MVPDTEELQLVDSHHIAGSDFASGGSVSIKVKNVLKDIGYPAELIRRVAIAAFEAEMNVVMYGQGGDLRLLVASRLVRLEVEDHGPGIADLDLAMQEGWSTATAEMREMGFGAGMGLPNIQKNSQRLRINTAPGRGTRIVAEFEIC